eukprot:2434953-Amphidinium_carterae.1
MKNGRVPAGALYRIVPCEMGHVATANQAPMERHMGRWTYDRTGQTCPAAAQIIDLDPGFRSVVDLGANPDGRAMAS